MATSTEIINGVEVSVEHAAIADLVSEQRRFMRDRLVSAAYELRERQTFIDQLTMDINLQTYTSYLNREVESFKDVIAAKTAEGEAMLQRRRGDRRAIPSQADRVKTAGYFGSRRVTRFLSGQEAEEHQAIQEKIVNFIYDKYDKKKKYQAASHVPEGNEYYTPPSHIGDLALLPIVTSCSEATDQIISAFDVYGCGKEEGEALGIPPVMSAIDKDVTALSLAKLVELGMIESATHKTMKVNLGQYKMIVGKHAKLESLKTYEIDEGVARAALEDLSLGSQSIEVDVNYLGGFSNAINRKRTIIVGQFTVNMTNARGMSVPVRIVAKFVSHDTRPLSVLVQESLVVDNHGNPINVELYAGTNPFVITVKGSGTGTDLHATGERVPLSEDEYFSLRVGRSIDDTRGAPFVRYGYKYAGSVVADNECRIASNFDPYTNMSWKVIEDSLRQRDKKVGLSEYLYENNLDLSIRHKMKLTSCCRTNIDLEDIPLTHVDAMNSNSGKALTNSRRRVFSSFVQLSLKQADSKLLNSDGFTDPAITKQLMIELLSIANELFLNNETEVFSVGPRSTMRRIVQGSALLGVDPDVNSSIRTFTTEDCLYRLIVSLVTRQDATVNSQVFPLISASQTVSRYLNTPLCTLYRNPSDLTSTNSVIAVYKASANVVDNLFDRIDLSNLLNRYQSSYDFVTRAMQSGHKALAGYTFISEPFVTVNTGFSTEDAYDGRVTVSIGSCPVSCDCLIADCLRAIMRKIKTSTSAESPSVVPERVFVFYHDKIAILFCLPNKILDSGNSAKVFINFSPRPSRMTRLIKSSTNVAEFNNQGIMLNTAIFGSGGVELDGYFESLPSVVNV